MGSRGYFLTRGAVQLPCLLSQEPPGGALQLSPDLGDLPLSTVSATEGQSSADPTLEVDGAPHPLHGGAVRARHGAQRPPTQASGGPPGEGVLCQVGRALLLALLLGEGAAGEPPGQVGKARLPVLGRTRPRAGPLGQGDKGATAHLPGNLCPSGSSWSCTTR